METLQGHFYQWEAVLFFMVIYGLFLLFVPLYKKMDRKPASAYLAFVFAFAIEMHGIPMSMYIISWIFGKTLPEGFLWGHTLFDQIGYLGMKINIVCAIIAFLLIANGWHNIYHQYWSKESGKGNVVKSGVYRYIRHPQYTGFMLLTLGMIVEWATLPTVLLWPLLVGMYVRLSKREEADMIEAFGEEYVRYMMKTKRFIPFII